MSKIYAVQMTPDAQYPIDLETMIEEDVKENLLTLYGNCYYEAHECDLFYQCRMALEDCDIWDMVEEYKAGLTHYHSMVELFMDMLPPVGKRGRYNIDEIKTMYRAICDYADQTLDFETAMVRMLTCVSGHVWHCQEIRGNCQGEWQMMYYPETAWRRKSIEYFEAEYFNTGSEWCMTALDEAPANPEDIMDSEDAIWTYCHEWATESIRAELADNYGTDLPVVMYKWTGYKRVSQYEEI